MSGGIHQVNGANAHAAFLTADGIHSGLKIRVRCHQKHLQIFAKRGLDKCRVRTVGFNQVAKHSREPCVILALGKNAFHSLVKTFAHGGHLIKQSQSTFKARTLLAPRRKARDGFGLAITHGFNRARLRLQLRVQLLDFKLRNFARLQFLFALCFKRQQFLAQTFHARRKANDFIVKQWNTLIHGRQSTSGAGAFTLHASRGVTASTNFLLGFAQAFRSHGAFTRSACGGLLRLGYLRLGRGG